MGSSALEDSAALSAPRPFARHTHLVESNESRPPPIRSNAFQPFKDEASIWPLPSFVRKRLAPMFAQLTQSEEGGRRGVHAGNRFADCSMRAKLTAGGRTDAMHDLGGVEDSLSLGLELHHTQGLEKKVLSCP